jgi:hypothetical protein
MNQEKGSWNKWYTAVVIVLLLQIAFYYWFTHNWS